jgi:hypothetical protein
MTPAEARDATRVALLMARRVKALTWREDWEIVSRALGELEAHLGWLFVMLEQESDESIDRRLK